MFDVDGTLTPSRGRMDEAFSLWFQSFCHDHNVYLVTGSDKPKTLEQVGENVYNLCKRVYQCSGNDVWEKDVNVKKNDWILPEEPHEWLSIKLTESYFPIRTGLHFEHRSGMVNFSILGRNATMGERKLYVEWDEHNLERLKIVAQFNFRFPELDAKAGGETGIDIGPKGSDKSQVIKFIDDEELIFFGDRMDPAGNDYPLSKIILDNDLGKCYNVKDYNETWDILKNYV